MERREVLVSVLSVGVLSGCASDTTESTTPNNTVTETTPSAGGCFPQFCEGSTIVDVDVDASFSGTVVLKAACRDSSYKLQSGDSVTITRQVDGETCAVRLFVNNQTEFDRKIADYVSMSLRIGPDGGISESIVEL